MHSTLSTVIGQLIPSGEAGYDHGQHLYCKDGLWHFQGQPYAKWGCSMGGTASSGATRKDGSRRHHCRRPGPCIFCVSGALIAVLMAMVAGGAGPAPAESCAAEIERTEAALNALTSRPGATAAHQSKAAQLHHQPTPHSLEQGRRRAQADEQHDRAALERARAADAVGDHAACLKALSEARKGIPQR